MLFEELAWRSDARHDPRPGIRVSSKPALNLYCLGEGNPTVPLEAGLGDGIEEWNRVQAGVARFTRVCSYDRAGYGSSEPGPMPRTADRIATELRTALAAAGEKPPFLLVGASFGGYLVRVFNGKYPRETVGLVLADSTEENQYRLLPEGWRRLYAMTRERAEKQARWAPVYIGLGIARLQAAVSGYRLPPWIAQAKYLRARASELLNIDTSAEQARHAGHIHGQRLIVLTAGQTIDASLGSALSKQDQRRFARVWTDDLQLRLANLSSKGRRVMVPDSGHDMPANRPDAIISAIRELCSATEGVTK